MTRREAEAKLSYSENLVQAKTRFLQSIGDASTAGSLASNYRDFEASLVASANDPSNTIRLDSVVSATESIASSLNRASAEVQAVREDADASLTSQVDDLNRLLKDVLETNVLLQKSSVSGNSTASLLDRQQSNIDEINNIIPVTVVKRSNDQVALFSKSGGVVFDGRPTVFEFNSSSTITQTMTFDSGALSGLIVNGVETRVGDGNSFFEGGALAADFEIRDSISVDFAGELDGLAEDLVLRFQDVSVDPSLSASDPGIFTNNGTVFAGPINNGLAGNLKINAALDPKLGGGSWRIRDGLNAATLGNPSQNQTIRNLETAMQSQRLAPTGLTVSRSLDASKFAAALSTSLSNSVAKGEDTVSVNSMQYSEQREAELSQIAVDTDQELQSLIQIETAYAANARVMSILDDLLKRLMEI